MGVQRLPHRHDARRPAAATAPAARRSPARTATCRRKARTACRYRSKIAGIQEYSNFPQAEHTLPAQEIDLPVRDGFAAHTLVGLNVFLIKMAQQFPDVLGHPHRGPDAEAKRGVDPST